MGKNRPKNREWPTARNGEKMAQKWRKNKVWGNFSIFFRRCWAIFSPFRPVSHFLFLGQIFLIFGFRPVFHSMPGGLTRNSIYKKSRREVIYMLVLKDIFFLGGGLLRTLEIEMLLESLTLGSSGSDPPVALYPIAIAHHTMLFRYRHCYHAIPRQRALSQTYL